MPIKTNTNVDASLLISTVVELMSTWHINTAVAYTLRRFMEHWKTVLELATVSFTFFFRFITFVWFLVTWQYLINYSVFACVIFIHLIQCTFALDIFVCTHSYVRDILCHVHLFRLFLYPLFISAFTFMVVYDCYQLVTHPLCTLTIDAALLDTYCTRKNMRLRSMFDVGHAVFNIQLGYLIFFFRINSDFVHVLSMVLCFFLLKIDSNCTLNC